MLDLKGRKQEDDKKIANEVLCNFQSTPGVIKMIR
jgi:hypothetical protein